MKQQNCSNLVFFEFTNISQFEQVGHGDPQWSTTANWLVKRKTPFLILSSSKKFSSASRAFFVQTNWTQQWWKHCTGGDEIGWWRHSDRGLKTSCWLFRESPFFNLSPSLRSRMFAHVHTWWYEGSFGLFWFFLSIGLFMIQISVNESFLVNLLQRKSMKESFLFPILESKWILFDISNAPIEATLLQCSSFAPNKCKAPRDMFWKTVFGIKIYQIERNGWNSQRVLSSTQSSLKRAEYIF